MLLQYLANKNPLYSAKLVELRSLLAQWLEYIPNTFPHFTRHGIAHSDQIIRELSHVLFHDGESEPIVSLSAMEVYLLCASAYLHDAGMVVSDSDKRQILESESWRVWTGQGGGGSKRWEEIRALQARAVVGGTEVQFVADVQTRYLVAEFVRRNHHTRVKNVLANHQDTLATFAFNDAAVLNTISDVCIGHGLDVAELEDHNRYPDRRTLRDELVNVRFVALLLRLGDLLDMSTERACPFVMSAAAPLPVDSIGHWSQYQRIVHRVVAPDRIELRAKCQTQDEHFLLLDWCTWLQSEVAFATAAMSRVSRHNGWVAPHVSIDGRDPTIVIEPAEGASYIPHRWTFELDAGPVFERLVKDVHWGELSFLRELLQNALDASRTQMYRDLAEWGEDQPPSPTKIALSKREQYPIVVEIAEVTIVNPLSGEEEQRQVIAVEDVGIGMNEEAIRRYLLQVGRSYYTSHEFVGKYPFAATSRYGVGFLSVFSAGDHVEVETYCTPPDRGAGSGLRLILNGPRTHFLTERVPLPSRGTRVSVRMQKAVSEADVVAMLRHWCKRVELPIVARTTVAEESINRGWEAEGVASSEYYPSGDGEQVVIHSIPVDENGIEGQIYVPGVVGPMGESWAEPWTVGSWARRDPALLLPKSWLAFHGLDVTPRPRYDEEREFGSLALDSLHAQLDIRGGSVRIPMHRHFVGLGLRRWPDLLLAVEPAYERLLDRHLGLSERARSSDGWQYKQVLSRVFPLPNYWWHVPRMLRAYRNGSEVMVSLEEARNAERLTLVVGSFWGDTDADVLAAQAQDASRVNCDLAVVERDVRGLGDHINYTLLGRQRMIDVRLPHEGAPEVSYGASAPMSPLFTPNILRSVYLADFPPSLQQLMCGVYPWRNGGFVLLNRSHVYTDWIRGLVAESRARSPRLPTRRIRKFLELLVDAYGESGARREQVGSFLDAWRATEEFPEDLCPPDEVFQPEWIEGRSAVSLARHVE